MSNLRTESVQAHDREIERLERLIAGGHRMLHFPRDLEGDFIDDYSRRFLGYRQRVMLLSLLVLLAAGVLDVFFVRNDPDSALLLRYGFVAPLAIALAVFSRTRWFPRWQQASLSVLTLLLAALLTGLLLIGDDRTILVYSPGLLLIAVLSGTLMYLLAVVAAGYGVVILHARPQEPDVVAVLVAYYVMAVVIALFGGYRVEHSARRQFLQGKLLALKQHELELANHQLQELVDQDGLTGIANRRHFDKQLVAEWSRARRGGYPISLLLIDLDYFKNYNDTYGHQAGDDCLIVVGSVLRAHTQRSGDVAARYGGEEFAMILPATDAADAEEIGWRVVRDIAAYHIPHRASRAADVVTASVGAACLIPSPMQTPRELIALADEALYRAKGGGRNRVVVSEAPLEGFSGSSNADGAES
jgi:diguanylate cyclase (GGDEF)-like protein